MHICMWTAGGRFSFPCAYVFFLVLLGFRRILRERNAWSSFNVNCRRASAPTRSCLDCREAIEVASAVQEVAPMGIWK